MAIEAMGQRALVNEQWRNYAGRVIQSKRGNRPNNIAESIRHAAKGQSAVEDQKGAKSPESNDEVLKKINAQCMRGSLTMIKLQI